MKTNKKAVSLIVLVITIIVLGILAATVIINVSNTNIIEMARKTVFKSDMANYKEAYNLYLAGEFAQDSDFDKSELNVNSSSDIYEVIFGNVADEHADKLSIVSGNLVYKAEDAIEQEVLTEMGILGSVASLITAANYGDTVEYSAGGVDEWKLFYKNNDYVYIITSDYLNNSLLPTEFASNAVANATYDVKWNTILSTSADDISSSVASKFMVNGWLSKAKNHEYYSEFKNQLNFKVTADLLKTSVWTSEFGNVQKGIEAVGAPTIEMIVASWNEKGDALNSDYYKALSMAIYESSVFFLDGEKHFQYDSSDDMVVTISKNSGDYVDDLYFPYSDFATNDLLYVCATPSGTVNFTMGVVGPVASYSSDYDTVLYMGDSPIADASTKCALRPVVAVPVNLVEFDSNGNLIVAD